MKRLLAAVCLLLLAEAFCAPRARAVNAAGAVRVHKCEPAMNAMTSYAGPGWVPGYYPPAGPYHWRNVYGYTYVEPPITTTSPELGIDFTNVSDKEIKVIEFGLVTNGNLVAEVRDVGVFSPGVEIKHRFGISENVFPLQTALPLCLPLRITFADGQVWTSPHLPKLQAKLRPGG